MVNNRDKNLSISVIGAGAWGTALALLIARNGYHVKLWCFEPEVANTIKETLYNEQYLPQIKLHTHIEPTTDLAHTLHNAQFVFETVPVQFLRSVLEKTQPFYTNDQTWIMTSKGIEKNTLFFPAQIIESVFKSNIKPTILSGPSFARDLANEQITAVDINTPDRQTFDSLKTILCNDYFSLHQSSDSIGIQVGGALKNIISIGVGILDGAGHTDNTKALFITHGLQEMALVTKVLGGNYESMYNLSGVGDLILSSMGSLGKNLAIGKRIGCGESLETVLENSIQIPEGINTVQSVYQLAERLNLNVPLCTGIYQILFKNKLVSDVLLQLIANAR